MTDNTRILQLVDQIRATLGELDKELATPSVIYVKPGDPLIQMLADAGELTTFAIDPAFVLDAPLVLSKPVTLVNAGGLPPDRMNATLQLPSFKQSLVINAPNVTIDGIEVTVPSRDYAVVTDNGVGTTLNRMRIVGNAAGARRGILTTSKSAVYIRLHVANIVHTQDSQAIVGWDGVKNLHVEDCYLAASGENIMFGGADASSEDNQPQMINIVGCTLEKDPSWAANTSIACKNLIELKNAVDVSVTDCDMFYSPMDGQDGYAIVVTVRNQNGKNPWASVKRATFANNRIAHTGGGVQILGRDDRVANPSGVMEDVTFVKNTFDDINMTKWGGTGNSILLNRGSKNLTFDGNVFTNTGLSNCFLYFVSKAFQHVGLKIVNNDFQEGRYGIQNDGGFALGKAGIDAFADGYQWAGNTVRKNVVNGRTIAYPQGTVMVNA